MQIIVIGAGIGGLSAALALAKDQHQVTLLESAPALAEIGAGVQLTPNATRWFWKWGCGEDIIAKSALPGSFNVRRASDGSVLGSVSFDETFQQKYGAPYVVIHRADVHNVLHQHAEKAGVKLHLNSRVVQWDFEGGSVTLKDGRTLSADLVVAVDGINSPARTAFASQYGFKDSGLEPTGWAAYRAMAKISQLRANPATAPLVSSHDCNCITGGNCCVMTYPVKNSEKLNIVLTHKDDVDTSEWTQEQFKNEVIRLFKDFGPSVHDLIELATNEDGGVITNWPVYQVKNLPRWTSDSGKFVLMGDAAHAMAFFLSMGVSLAAEDAAGLAECIRLHTESNGKVSLGAAMKVFETVRKPRAEAVKEASLHAGNMLQLSPGSDCDIRNEALRTHGHSLAKVPASRANDFYKTKLSYGILDEQIRDWGYGYNVVDDIRETWAKMYATQ